MGFISRLKGVKAGREEKRRAKAAREEEMLAQMRQMQKQLDEMHKAQDESTQVETTSRKTQEDDSTRARQFQGDTAKQLVDQTGDGKEEVLITEMHKLQSSVIDLQRKASYQAKAIAKSQEQLKFEELVNQMNKMRSSMIDMQEKNLEHNRSVLRSQEELKVEVLKSNDAFIPPDYTDLDEEPIDSIPKGHFEVVTSNRVTWRVSGYSSIIPHPDYNYFPGLQFEPLKTDDGIYYNYSEGKVISVIVPCFNEGGADLERTIRSLDRQRLPPGWRIEVVIVMDGADHMDETMSAKLYTLFGIRVNSGDPATDPMVALPEAETIVVDPADEQSAYRRTPAMDGTVGGYSLVVKRHNHRKANSQMWWLGPHGSFLKCKYALATDCGTVFARTATIHLIRRLDAEQNLHAVTGFQRIMTSEMQGDGSWEFFHRPFEWLLRMCQRFEFEVDHVSFKSIYDTIGCMHVIPGPCGLFRYSAMGTLRKGLMHQYFHLFQHSSQGLIVGNVELVEDRIPGTLLSFPLKDDKAPATMPPEGWPRTGFVHEALFYVESEKPLSQLIKQRRRWLNGTFATYIWMLNEGIISKSNQDPVNKFLSWLLVILNVIQGLVVRFFGPALLVVWMFRFGLFIPDIFNDPTAIFDPKVSLTALEIEDHRLGWGVCTGGAYLILYIAYILGHIPHAKPVTKGIQITRYTEPTAYACDKQSSYRWWLFTPVLVVNFFVICLFGMNVVGIIATRGWSGTPVVVQVLICICVCPFFMGIFEGLLNRDFRCLLGMLYSTPGALVLIIWFTIWLPAYATTRLSDLTWGNRDQANSLDESEKALRRAQNGQKVGWLLISSTTLISAGTITLMQWYHLTFPIYVMSYTLILSMTYLLSFFDLIWRFITCSSCTSDDPVIEEYGEEDDACINCAGDEYVAMKDGGGNNDNTVVVTPPITPPTTPPFTPPTTPPFTPPGSPPGNHSNVASVMDYEDSDTESSRFGGSSGDKYEREIV